MVYSIKTKMMNKDQKNEALKRLATMPREQKIQKIKSIISGELTVDKVFKPFTVQLWIEMEPALFEGSEDRRRLTSDQINELPDTNCFNIQIVKFHPDGQPVG
jgi:hypothetical protein